MKLPDNLELLVPADEIECAIDRVAVQLNVELRNVSPVFICVMKGGLPFTWDLMKRINLDVELDFVRVNRYNNSTPGEVKFERDVTIDLSDRTVVLIDDILDEGVTLEFLVDRYRQKARSVHTCVLVDKNINASRSIHADHAAVECPNLFLVGRGMDFNGRYRQLPAIYALQE